MSKGFHFIKNKQDKSVPEPQTPLDLFKTTNDNPPPKKGFGFIKKVPKENNLNPQTPVSEEKKEEAPKSSLDSLFANDALFNITDAVKNNNDQPELSQINQSGINNPTTFNNELMNDFSGIAKEYLAHEPSPKVSTSSLPGKKGFSFIKKNKEEQNKTSNLLGIIDNPSILMPQSNNDLSNINQGHFNINNQFNEDYEAQFFKNDQSENCSVSSKKNYSETNQNMINSPKVSSTKSIPISDTVPEEIILKKPSLLSMQNALKKESATDSYVVPQHYQSSSKLTDQSVKLSYEIQKKNSISSYLEYILNIHRLKEQLKTNQEELIGFKYQQEKLIADEQLAIEENDFERADHIENIIKGLIERIAKANKDIIATTQELMNLREKELSLLRLFKKETEDISNSYVKLKQSTDDAIESFMNKELSKHHSENIRLKKMKEKLQFLKSNLNTEKNYIDEEEAKILIVIKSQSSGIFDELDDLNKNKAELNNQIEELKRQLEAKENELYILNGQIENKESEIEAIKSNFNHDFGKIDIKKKNYIENLKDYEDQENNYDKKNNDYDNLDKEYQEKMTQMKNQMNIYDQEIESMNKEKEKKEEQLSIKESLLQKENCTLMKMNKIVSQIESSQEIMKKHNDDIQKLNVNNKQLESEISQIEIRLPVLEEEKNSVIKVKNFKEAARVSNILKTSLEQKNTNLSKILDNKRIINDFATNVNNLSNKIASLTKQKQEEEIELKKIQYEYMNDYLASLLAYSNEGVNNGILTQEILSIQEDISAMERLDYIQPIKVINNNDQSNLLSNNLYSNHINTEEHIENNDFNLIQDSQTIEENQPCQISKEEAERKIEELNQDLQEAIIKEDYEAADKIQTEIDELTIIVGNS